MIIDAISAAKFIAGYKRVLLLAADRLNVQHAEITSRLALTRSKLYEDQELLDEVIQDLSRAEDPLSEDMAVTIRRLDLRQWIYLKDTRRYSVFMQSDGAKAFAVLGLTERIRYLIGGSGVIVTTSVGSYNGKIICDGLFIGQPVWLGSNYRRSFAQSLACLKEEGKFYTG